MAKVKWRADLFPDKVTTGNSPAEQQSDTIAMATHAVRHDSHGNMKSHRHLCCTIYFSHLVLTPWQPHAAVLNEVGWQQNSDFPQAVVLYPGESRGGEV